MTTVASRQTEQVLSWTMDVALPRMKVAGVRNVYRFVRLAGCPILLLMGLVQLTRCTPSCASAMLERVGRDGHEIAVFLSQLRGTRRSLHVAISFPSNMRVTSGQRTTPRKRNKYAVRHHRESETPERTEIRPNAVIRHRRLPQSALVHQHEQHSMGVAADGLSGNGRPIMYTFYTHIDNRNETGMSNDANQRLIEAWKEEWNRHGCDTQVLGLETAQQHSDFRRYNSVLDTLEITTYERYCFLRYLAMAVVSGGWMCDYDTFPLHPHDGVIPNDGKFTVHEYSKNGGVPSLVSGSKEEHRHSQFMSTARMAVFLP